jgi:hypothetical protein
MFCSKIRPSSISEDNEGETKEKQQQEEVQVGRIKCSGLDWAQKGSKWRLLQLVGNLLDKGLGLVLIPSDDLVLLLDSEAALTEGDDVEGSILVASRVVDNGLEETAGLGEEGLCSLLRSSVDANAADDVDLGQVAAVSEQGHARHGGGLHVASDGDGNHGLASLVADHADKVQSSGGSVEAESNSVEDEASLSSQLDNRD